MKTQNSIYAHSPSFVVAITFVLGEEGDYVNDPADSGGETKYGISQRAYPELDIKHLTLDQAQAIYYQDYWLKCRCDQLPAAAACVVLDTAVNMGHKAGIRFLQQSLWVKADGLIGPVTLTAAQQQPILSWLCDYFSRRAKRYQGIAVATPSQRRFSRGWFKRCFELQQYLYEERLI